MLVEQLKHQNPLDPMKDMDFIAQLAQFSALEQLQNLNDEYTTSQQIQLSINNMLAADFIGKEVTANVDKIWYKDGKSSQISFNLDEGANVAVRIIDNSGTIVRTMNLEAVPAGEHVVKWDGKDNRGIEMGNGDYSFQIFATSVADRHSLIISPVVMDKITGVKFSDGSARFLLGGHEIPMNTIVEIH